MGRTSVTIQLDDKVKSSLEKRAKREMMELDALIVDILRRSVVSLSKKSSENDNVDDKFLSYFSRKEKVDYMKAFRKKKGNEKPLYERRFV